MNENWTMKELKELIARKDLLESGEAAQYLANRWGIQSYSTSALKMLRHRWGIEPAFPLGTNTTYWLKSELDQIPKPSRNNPRPKRLKKNGGGESGLSKLDVMLMELSIA